jgi:putative flippase GtrA
MIAVPRKLGPSTVTSIASLAGALGAHPLLRKFITFAALGICGTAVHYALLAALVEWGHVPVLIATTCGMAAGAVVNYALSRRFVFDSQRSHSDALPKFLVIAAIGAAFNWLVMAALLRNFAIYYLFAQVIATGTVLVWNFVANSLWTFRR